MKSTFFIRSFVCSSSFSLVRSFVRSSSFSLVLYLGLLGLTVGARAGSWLGDAGHFFNSQPDIFVNNPKGKAFTVTVRRHVWPTKWGQGKDQYEVTVFDPENQVAVIGKMPKSRASVTVKARKGKKGVYKIKVKPAGYTLYYVECSLEQMVVACGKWDADPKKPYPDWYNSFYLHVMAPRRWYFFVPPGVKTFQVRHTLFPYQSHREDYGFFVNSPRGQRMAAFFGGKSLDFERVKPNKPPPVTQTIETDEGTTARFWSIWACGGESHNFSDLSILLKGVPPYFSQTPEAWFDPTTGKAPKKIIYDDSPVRLTDGRGKVDKHGKRLSRDHYFWAPATFLGDEDYNGMKGPATIYIFNPENRKIDFGVCSYIIPEKMRLGVSYRVTAPNGKVVLRKTDTYGHADSSRIHLPQVGRGVYRIDVDAGEWFAWNEPATPMVLAGKATGKRRSRFNLQVGIARHWFFKVPKRVKKFKVAVSVADKQHVLRAEVHAPDRLLELLYVRGGKARETEIEVASGLDDKIWFLRLNVGSATRFVSEDVNNPKHVRIDTQIELEGVPGYLAPTYEQWFHPRGK